MIAWAEVEFSTLSKEHKFCLGPYFSAASIMELFVMSIQQTGITLVLVRGFVHWESLTLQ